MNLRLYELWFIYKLKSKVLNGIVPEISNRTPDKQKIGSLDSPRDQVDEKGYFCFA
jgi:hypothetical protein